MTCADSVLLTEFILGELPPQQQQFITEHLKQCTECRQKYLALKQINREIKCWRDDIATPPDFSNQLEQALTQKGHSFHLASCLKSKTFVGLGAAAVALVLSLGLWDHYQQSITPVLESEKNMVKEERLVLESEDKKEQVASRVVTENDSSLPEQVTVPKVSGKYEQKTTDVASETGCWPQQQTFQDSTFMESTSLDAVPELNENNVKKQPLDNQASIKMMFGTQPFIEIEIVKQVEILEYNSRKSILTPVDHQQQILLLIQGINNAQPLAAEQQQESWQATHSINIALTNGKVFTFQYNQETNSGQAKGFFGGEMVIPGATLQKGLVSH